MPTTSALQAVPVPTTADAPTIPANMLTHVQYMEKRLVMRYTDTTQRDATILTPENGMVVYLTTTKAFTFYDGTGWKALVSSLLSPVVSAVDAVNSGGQMTLKGAGSNKSWGVKSQAGELIFRYDFEGTPATILSIGQTAVTLTTNINFVKDGVTQPTIRSGSAAPNNATGVDGDLYVRF